MASCKLCGGALRPGPADTMICSFCGAKFPKSECESAAARPAASSNTPPVMQQAAFGMQMPFGAQPMPPQAPYGQPMYGQPQQPQTFGAQAPYGQPQGSMGGTVMTPTPGVDVGTFVYDSSAGGVLEICCRDRTGAWSGSGYIITRDGYAITNAHVAASDDGSPCPNMVVKVRDREIRARVIALADDHAGKGRGDDLALIKLDDFPCGAKALPFGNSASVRNGQTVFAIGNSLGRGTCIVSGIVSDAKRILHGKPMIMTDCATNPGNSGGPLFDKSGCVIGTIVAHAVSEDGKDAAGMRYAIPAETVLSFVRRFINL